MMLTFFPLHLSSSSSYHPLSYRPVSVPSSKPQSRLWQPRWTWPTLKSSPDWISDRDQSAIIHIAASLKSIWQRNHRLCVWLFLLWVSSPFWASTPHSCICVTYARFPYTASLPNMVVPRWLARHFSPNAIPALSHLDTVESTRIEPFLAENRVILD